jgi:hypothetical protein
MFDHIVVSAESKADDVPDLLSNEKNNLYLVVGIAESTVNTVVAFTESKADDVSNLLCDENNNPCSLVSITESVINSSATSSFKLCIFLE